MSNDPDLLERTFEKVRALPVNKLKLLGEFIDDLANESDFHHLTPEEIAVLEPAMVRAQSGVFASDEDVKRVLGRVVK